jgi:hypothetical protein
MRSSPDMLAAIGMEAFADRARNELAATGEPSAGAASRRATT